LLVRLVRRKPNSSEEHRRRLQAIPRLVLTYALVSLQRIGYHPPRSNIDPNVNDLYGKRARVAEEDPNLHRMWLPRGALELGFWLSPCRQLVNLPPS
jgi:hypothetical protein